jgi:hypothetical protein
VIVLSPKVSLKEEASTIKKHAQKHDDIKREQV